MLCNQFSLFLSDKIGLITSDKNNIFVPLPRFLSEITHLVPSKIRRLATTQGSGDGKPAGKRQNGGRITAQ